MNNCLKCGKEIIQKNGGKERLFCDNNNKCKQTYHNKKHKEPKMVKLTSFQELKDKFDAVVKENIELKSLVKKNGALTNAEFDKAVSSINLTRTLNDRPIKQKGEDAIDFAIRLNEWKLKQ